MKTDGRQLKNITLAIALILSVITAAHGQTFSLLSSSNAIPANIPAPQNIESGTNLILPLIEMHDVPISTAINNFARIAGINYLIPVRLGKNWPSSDADEPLLTFRWENLTARQALLRLLKEHDLVLVENPATPIALITHINQVVNPVDASLLGSDTNEPAPLIQFQDVSLDEAFKQLAKAAQIKVAIDPILSERGITLDKKSFHKPIFRFSWQNITPRQGIVALCKNYDLVIVKDSATGVISIKSRD